MKIERPNFSPKEAFELLERRRLEKVRCARPKREKLAQEINGDSDFDINEWLEDIRSRAGEVIVEVGHGYRPWIKEHPLLESQMYIGVEAEISPFFIKHPLIKQWNVHTVINSLRKTRPNDKIIFTGVHTGFDPNLGEKGIYTDYNPQSYLPDEIANQVLVTNVFDDPRLHTHGCIEKLFKELARLTKPGGKIIVHEDSLVTFSKEVIDALGLKARFVAFAELNPEEFKQLYKHYHVGPNTHYTTNAEYILVVEKPE